ncbi:Uncharacterised protein [uncultured Clostridium sp.]|nr:Uncharacterised protein [uncultured Clostridium sp.]
MRQVIDILQYMIGSWFIFLWAYMAVIIFPKEGNFLALFIGLILTIVIGCFTGHITWKTIFGYVKKHSDDHRILISAAIPTFIIFIMILLVTIFVFSPFNSAISVRGTTFIALCAGTISCGIIQFRHRDEIKEDELKHPGLITKIPQWGKVIISCFWLVITVISLGYIITL